MNLVGMELAFMTMSHKASTVCLQGWPVVMLEDLLGECPAINMTATFTGMGIFNNLMGFLLIETPEVTTAERFSE